MLTFDDSLEITQMISDEGEKVSLVRKINPQLANVSYLRQLKRKFKIFFLLQGLVELWLKEVESTMLDSVKEQMKFAWDDYFMQERIQWVVSWPGQVVLGISCMAWTYEVNFNNS